MSPGWASRVCALSGALLLELSAQPVEKITASVSVVRGAVNGALVERGAKTLAIYGDPRSAPSAASMVLFTHHRRDVVWAGRGLISHGAQAVGPEAEKPLFSGVVEFWDRYRTARFHDYANQSSRILAEPLALTRTVRGGDTLDWQGLAIHV